MRILIVNGDASQAKLLEMTLNASRFNPYVADTVEEGLELADLYDYDLILVSLGMFGAEEMVGRLRTKRVNTPVMYLTDAPEHAQTADLLNAGADDVMATPIHRDELTARVTAIVRRSKGHPAAKISTGPLEVNLDSKTVTVLGNSVHLTGKEYDMLELLSLRKGTTLTKEAFLNHLYGGMDEPEIKIVDVFVCKLRKKLANAGAEGLINTVWGRGYVLQEPEGIKQLENLVATEAATA